MQRIFQKEVVLVLGILLLGSFAIPAGPVYAKSSTWTYATSTANLEAILFDDSFCYLNCDFEPELKPKYTEVGGIGGPSASITHAVTILDTTTSTNVDDGSTVAVGDTIVITPQANQSTDISWFAIGYGTDSPYGSWGGGAVTPSQNEKANGWLSYNVVLGGQESFENFANLAVTPTTPTITTGGTATLSCTGGTCVVKSAGTVTATVTYPATNGKFYYSYWKNGQLPQADGDWSGPDGANVLTIPMADQASLDAANCLFTQHDGQLDACLADSRYTYVINVPAIPITVSFNAAIATPPTAPTITGPTTGDTCSASNYTYTFTGTDPNGKTIRYGVDWNDDGAVDEWVPAIGYVNSGTVQPTTHSWNTPGTYTFQAETQNSDGSVSGWTTYSITISPCSLPNLVPTGFTPTVVIAGTMNTFIGTIQNTGSKDTPQAVPADIYVCLQSDDTCVGSLALSFWQRFIAEILGGVARAAAAVDIQLTPLTIPSGQTTNPQSISQAIFPDPGTYEAELCADTPISSPPISVVAGDNLCTPKTILAVCPTGYTVGGGACCSLSASPTNVPVNGSATLTWDTYGTATSCTGSGFSTGAGSPASGSTGTGPLAKSQTYDISCQGPTGICSPAPVTVTVPGPTATITANPTRVEVGSTTALTWSSTNAASCTMKRNALNWTKPGTGGATSGTNVTDFTAGGITVQTTYTLTCSGAVASTTVNIAPGYTNF